MLTPSELFIIYLFIGLFIFLGIVFLFSFSFILKKREIEDNNLPRYSQKTVKNRRKVQAGSKASNIGGDFREKLGEKIVRYMIDISKSGEKKQVTDRIQKIIQECNNLNSLKLPAENKRIISTVLLWAKGFETDRHISEIKIFQRSSQISYDPKKRDFQLRLFGK